MREITLAESELMVHHVRPFANSLVAKCRNPGAATATPWRKGGGGPGDCRDYLSAADVGELGLRTTYRGRWLGEAAVYGMAPPGDQRSHRTHITRVEVVKRRTSNHRPYLRCERERGSTPTRLAPQ